MDPSEVEEAGGGAGGGETNSTDEYHDDGLPDLVQETPEFRASSLSRPGSASCSPSSSLDLLNVVAASREAASSASTEALHSSAGAASRGRSRAADADPACYKEEDYLPNGGGAASEEILTEVSRSSRGVFKVHYLDHSKAYVPPAAAAAAVDTNQSRYRSYLSLMPEDVEEEEEEEGGEEEGGGGEDGRRRRAKSVSRERILSDFQALSYEDQLARREEWAKELDRTFDEISAIKEKLAVKTAWCGVLRRNLGISKWRRLSDACASATKSAAADFQEAIAKGKEETKILSSQSLQKARDSFEQLSNEVRERVRQGREEVAKRVSLIRVTEEEEEEEEEGEIVSAEGVDGNSNKKTHPVPPPQSQQPKPEAAEAVEEEGEEQKKAKD